MEKLQPFLRAGRTKLNLTILLFCAILLLGIFARTWEFRSLPPGVNEDEASSGVDAFSLYHYGVDRNGISFPVYLVSWGSGQNALNAYVMIPFIALGGLSPFTVRLPALIAGILTLPLVYLIGKRTVDEKFGLAAMFLLAISPWHILMSRWGFEGNLLPFIFAVAYLCLLKSTEDNRWFIPAMFCMGCCLYAYGEAYAAIPIFLLCAIPILMQARKIRLSYVIIGLGLLALMSVPIGLFLLINTRQMDSIRLGLITIPRLPATPRYETISAIFQSNPWQVLLHNLNSLFQLLWVQEDGFFFNTVYPYGYFYTYTLPLAILGVFLLIPFRRTGKILKQKLLLAWLIMGIVLGILQEVNINRINLIFIPLLFCIAAVLGWIAEHSKIGLVLAVCTGLTAFVLFTRDYHGKEYRTVANREFAAGLLQAIDFAAQQGDGPICVTKNVHQPYIFVLFARQMNPFDYLPTIKYANPHGIFRQVLRLDRYRFGPNQCTDEARAVYILSGETPPQSSIVYIPQRFGDFTVYVP
jgi:hypothetical protein